MLAIYVRLSKEDDSSNSIDHQVIQANEYKSKLPEYINNFKVYNEGEGLSGTKDRTKRPQLDNLINDIEGGLITSVWMRKQDRLARSGFIALEFAEKIKNNNVYLYFGDKGHTDLNDTMVYFHFGQMALFDELKPKMQSEETIKSLRVNAEEGKTNGTIPYGYLTKEMFPYVVENEAEIVNQIFDKYLEGNGTFKIANYLNDKGIPTKRRNKTIWECATVKNVLKCKWYIGERTYQGITYNNIPKIVDEAKFEKVQQAIENRKSQRFGDKTKYDYLLRGIIKCHKCGRNYIGRTRPEKLESYYQCSSKRSKHTNCGNGSLGIAKLDTFILKHLFHSKELIERLEDIQNSNNVVNQLKEDVKNFEANFKKAEAKVIRYAKLIGGTDDKYILKEYDNSKKHLEKIELGLKKSKMQFFDATNSEALIKYKKVINDFKVDTDFETIKSAVHSIIETVTIESNKDSAGKLYFLIKIDYKGFNEYSMFAVIRPYKKWLYLSETKSIPTPEEIQDDIDALEFAYGDKKPKGKVFTEADVRQDFYTERNLEPITVNKSELIDFNKQPRIV